MRKIVTGILLLFSFEAFSQLSDSVKSESWEKIYRASATKINDLVHTKLDVKFDYSRSWMYGKAWLTLHPHFYPTDSLNLDARGMSINEVSMIKAGKHLPLKYVYDKHNLRIILDKSYKGGEDYTVFIDYVAKPNDIDAEGRTDFAGVKGLNFINPMGKDKTKPVQIWTQGETESNSGWVPTIDKPNQKTTDEIIMTVPGKFQTLSNGLLVSHKKNSDGTRTDTWRMDLPHAPYLMMMAVGEYSIIKDSYKGREVSYYVEKEYAPVARKIFGLTPEMIGFFSRITGVDFPWPKYAQIIGADFFDGAMENTTATMHGELAQQDARQLIDGNSWEEIIAHELFHQWFGDYVTTESWSNTTVNESFADFSEILWDEYKYGKDAGDGHNYNAMMDYLRYGDENKDLVRFYYKDQMDMFDYYLSYLKGGRILNMLRNYVGDSAFFKSINLLLTTKKFKTAEAQDIRLAFEEVTGQDLNWFWNEWYYGSGHPKLDISYDYEVAGKTAKVFIKQNQGGKIFRFFIAVDVYQGGEKKRYKVWVDQATDTLSFPAASMPDLINVDGDKILLCKKTDHKTLDNYIFQYNNAGLYVDRREAIDFAAGKQSDDPKALDLMKTALKDRYHGLRIYSIQKLNIENDAVKNAVELLLVDLAKNDPESLVRSEAIGALGNYKRDIYKELFLKSINDSSWSVAGNAMLALSAIDSVAALNRAKMLSSQLTRGILNNAINKTLYRYSGESEFDKLAARFDNLPSVKAKFSCIEDFSDFLIRVNNTPDFMKGIDIIISFRDSLPDEDRKQYLSFINGMFLKGIATAKQALGMTEQADYVTSRLPAPKEQIAYDVPMETMQKYPGEYVSDGATIKIILKDKTLNFIFPGNPAMELIPVSKNKFTPKFMEDQSIEFICNQKDEVVELLLLFPGGQIKALKTK